MIYLAYKNNSFVILLPKDADFFTKLIDCNGSNNWLFLYAKQKHNKSNENQTKKKQTLKTLKSKRFWKRDTCICFQNWLFSIYIHLYTYFVVVLKANTKRSKTIEYAMTKKVTNLSKNQKNIYQINLKPYATIYNMLL